MKEYPRLFTTDMIIGIQEDRKTMTRRTNISKIKPGDRIWCKETYRPWHEWDFEGCACYDFCSCPKTPPTPVCYRALCDEPDEETRMEYGIRWKPSIFMPKKLARLWCEVEDVFVQQLQEISHEDAIAEGVCVVGWKDTLIKSIDGETDVHESVPIYCDYLNLNSKTGFLSPIDSFRTLWDSINGKKPGKAWHDNPVVQAIRFKRLEVRS